MERLLSAIVSFPSSKNTTVSEYNKELRGLYEILTKAPASLLASTRDNDPLELLDNEQHSLGVLFILHARITVDQTELSSLWPRLTSFFDEFDGRQTRVAADLLKVLLETALHVCTSLQKHLPAVRLLKSALLRSCQPDPPKTFSYIHPLFVMKCVEAKCFRQALSVLDVDIEAFPSAKDKSISYIDHLKYYYYGAVVYMGQKRWKRAAEFLQYVITCPGSAVSTIQVDAVKKLILVNLMLTGKFHALPKSTPLPAARAFRALTKPYESFAQAQESRNTVNIRHELDLTVELFKQDGNWGLVRQTLQNFRTLAIGALTYTYSTLSIEHISARDFTIQSEQQDESAKPDIENLILNMIEDNHIYASLSYHTANTNTSGISTSKATNCMVTFHDQPLSESNTLQQLEEQIQRIVQVTEHAHSMDLKLGLTKEWISFLSRKNHATDTPKRAPSHLQEPGSGDVEDSDLMGKYGSMQSFDYGDDDFMRGDMDDP